MIVEQTIPVPDGWDGTLPLENLLGLAFREPALPRPADSPPARCVFLDVETTGLGSGAGTLVFLIGLAYAGDGVVHVQQFFLHDPAAERELLGAVAAVLANFSVVITFNGKCFDAPMLLGRFDFHRLPNPLPTGHVDLLHLARRIWGRRLGRSSLSVLEAMVLGIAREADILGSEVPERYFAFLREGRADAIGPVIEHNRYDLRSMVALARRVDRMLSQCDPAKQCHRADLLGVGRILQAVGRLGDARICYEEALIGASTGERAEALFRLATLVDRERDLTRAIDLLTSLADYRDARAIYASLELAKIHEHRLGEPGCALVYARRAQELARSAPAQRPGAQLADVERRLARLERKVKAQERARDVGAARS